MTHHEKVSLACFAQEWGITASVVNRIAREHGWWDGQEVIPGDELQKAIRLTRQMPELIALCHSELSEALEGYRKGDDANVAEELADCVIRIMDMDQQLLLGVAGALKKKVEINEKRPYRHGNKRA